ncbi:CMRF35-like molecule 5 isoform X3 [Sciurus carolinensis]|uniref:CMRF35-like molecule 5 isoform X3 n=1 Tax=Sciurus carolinensis TaxID=30640 RepID=UPI001FB292CE|nr:CMRF35-like molecule 5 isoform X3 [Sciurus carolinensis]
MQLSPALLFLLLPGYSTAQSEVTGPKTESGPERGSLTVQCNYTSKWKTHHKYWCGGAQWSSCRVLVITTGSEQEVKKDRVSIRDDQEKLTFMVTMVDLRREDAGTYWCGVERTGQDHGFQVNVTIDPGYSTAQSEVTGPKTESGPERGSLTVQCNYTSKWKTHRKYWCGGAQWSSCRVLVITTGSEQEVKKDRVSIRDDQEKLTFMVTMVDLRREDTGFYWCAIERTGIDYRFQVNVNVDPATGNPGTVRTTTVPSPAFISSITEKTGNPPVTHTTNPLKWSLFSSTYFLLLVFLEVPLLLSMLCAVLWVNRPQRCSGRR